MNVIVVNGLSVSFDTHVALSGIDWLVKEASLSAVIGPNGGGKSTLLKTIMGLIPPQTGEVRVFGRLPKKSRGQIAYLPQAEEVEWDFPISGQEVVLQGRLAGKSLWKPLTREDHAIAWSSLERVKMTDVARQPLTTLSGGQKQRIFLARALAQKALLIVLDEPATGLDAAAQHELRDLFIELKQQGITIIISTHDLTCLTEGFDQVLALDRQVIAQGEPGRVLSEDMLSRLFARHFPVIKASGEVRFHEH